MDDKKTEARKRASVLKAVFKALKARCFKCGCADESQLVVHHNSYETIYDIEICCRKCHDEIHKATMFGGHPAWNKGRKMSEYMSPEDIKKWRESKKGQTAWNKGKKRVKNCLRCKSEFSPRNHRNRTAYCSRRCAALDRAEKWRASGYDKILAKAHSKRMKAKFSK